MADKIEYILNLINKYQKKKIDKSIIEKINNIYTKLPLELKENILILQIRKGNLQFFNYIKLNESELNKFKINPFHFALNMGDTKILKKLLEFTNINNLNSNNLTLLEVACLNRDTNSIDFLLKYGANMQKHIILRESKHKLKINCLDIANLCSFILNLKESKKINKLKFLGEYLNLDEDYPFEGIKMIKIIEGIEILLSDKIFEYIKTIKKDLVKGENICNFEIVLLYLIPFLDNVLNYPFNLENENLLITELLYLIILFYNKNDYKKNIYEKLNKYYLEKKILKEDYLGILIKKSFRLFKKLQYYKNI